MSHIVYAPKCNCLMQYLGHIYMCMCIYIYVCVYVYIYLIYFLHQVLVAAQGILSSAFKSFTVQCRI